ncbi:hypothetical protein EDC04DRAFT_2605926 [Pisolithus marmoratus]|nr:hypothetical protein EDC04DRAFT_2605926 [Pisolithus marmoratus]
MCHFKDSITALKQVTSQAQRDMQHYMIAVIGGAASQDVVTAIHTLMDFQYLAQAPHITLIVQDKINMALLDFHNHKDAITEEDLWRGTESGSPLDHWLIPKLELMQNVALSISKLGTPMQWLADMTEHAHIECTDNTDHAHNHDDLEELATKAADIEYGETNEEDNEGEAMAILDDIWSPRWPVPNFFAVAEWLRTALHYSIPYPVCTFASGATALHLNYKPSITCISISEAAELFNLPDLQGALADYLHHEGAYAQNFHSFGWQWHSPPDAHLPFADLQIWYKVHLQQKSYHNSGSLQPVFTVNAQPPDCTWKYGCHDAVILQVDVHHEWPSSSLTGHAVVDVHLIMCPLSPKGVQQVWDDHFLVYVWQFDIVPQQQASVD